MSDSNIESGFVVWIMRAFGTVLIVAVITLIVAHFNNINSLIGQLRTDMNAADLGLRSSIESLKERDTGLGPINEKLNVLKQDSDAIKIELKSLTESQPKQTDDIQLLKERLSVLEGKISKVKIEIDEAKKPPRN